MNQLKRFIFELLLIKDGESLPLFHFWFVFMLVLGVGLSFGRASSDTLFFSRYGIEYLPQIYIILAPILAIVSIIYAAAVDRFSSEKFFHIILVGLMASVLVSWLLMKNTDYTFIYPVYYIIHKVASELILVHGSLYLIHNFNTLQAKRLFPLIFTGEQLGCVIGGILVSISASYIETVDMALLWFILMLFGILQIYAWHRQFGSSPYYQNIKVSGSKIKTSITSIIQGLKFTKESALLRNASLALFFLVIVYYILSYSTNRIFVSNYKSERDLAEFLGLLTAVTSAITLLFQLFITNRIIKYFGVKKLNLVFPLITASISAALLSSFTIVVAVITSVVRDSLLNALQNPVRIIFFNALPSYILGRAGAVSIAFVMPVALFICGVLLVVLQEFDNTIYFLLPCFLLSIGFLYSCYKMNSAFTKELTKRLKQHLYFSDNKDKNIEVTEDALSNLQNIFDKLPQSRGITAQLIMERNPLLAVKFLNDNADYVNSKDINKSLKILFEKTDRSIPYEKLKSLILKHPDSITTLLILLANNNYQEASELAENYLTATVEKTRAAAAAAYAILKEKNAEHGLAISTVNSMLTGNQKEQLASLIILPLLEFEPNKRYQVLREKLISVAEELTKNNDLTLAGTALKRLCCSKKLRNKTTIIKNCVERLKNDTLAENRLFAIYGLPYLETKERYETYYRLLNDTDDKVKSKTLLALKDSGNDFNYIVENYLIKGKSSPRIQSVLLGDVIKDESVSHDTLKLIALNRATDANYYRLCKITIERLKSTRNFMMLKDVYNERQYQLIDLSLQALTPLVAKDLIAVVRAGLASKNNQHIANACEILNHIENQPATIMIEQQLHDKKNNIDNKFTTVDDVLSWSKEFSDNWVLHIIKNVEGNNIMENNSKNIIERISLLKQTDIFSDISTEDLFYVAKELDESKSYSGERIFDINEYGDCMYIIISGEIGISINPSVEEKDFIVKLTSGSSFGEMNLLDNLPRSATAHVIKDATLLTLKKDKLIGLIRSYPDLSLGILRALSLKIRENHERKIKTSLATK